MEKEVLSGNIPELPKDSQNENKTSDEAKTAIEVIDVEIQNEQADTKAEELTDLKKNEGNEVELEEDDDDIISLKEEDPLMLPLLDPLSSPTAIVTSASETFPSLCSFSSSTSSTEVSSSLSSLLPSSSSILSQITSQCSTSASPISVTSSAIDDTVKNAINVTACSITSDGMAGLSPSNNASNGEENSASKNTVPLDMMPTIPLVPVQVPSGRGGSVTLGNKIRGRARCFSNTFASLRPGLGITIKRGGGKVKRLGSNIARGGRRLVHSMSLDDKGILGLREDSSFPMDDEMPYSQDDMFVTPTVQDKWADKTCAFCCLSKASQLGQGELNQYEATPSFNLPEKAHFTEDVLREASSGKKFSFKASSLKSKISCPKKAFDMLEYTDEMTIIGHTERPNLAVLFTTIGQCFAHYMCALWSNGVELASDDTIACVDKAVVSASERKCFYCKRLGASIKCNAPGCQIWYHFPCATTVGALMDLKSVAMVCPSHSAKAKDHLVEMSCMVCDSSSPESSLLFCCTCGNHYHGLCLKPSLTVTSIIRTGWQCPDCKICQVCRQSSDELVCIVCDKSYHSVCARPQGLSHSRTDWKCKACRVCGDCGSRVPGSGLSSRWHLNFSVCDSCYQLRNKGFACPICKKAYRAIMQKSLAQCTICRSHVHSACDPDADMEAIHTKWLADRSYEYTCLACKTNPTARLQSALRSPDREDSLDLHDSSMMSEDSFDIDMGSEDSLASPVKSFSTGLSMQNSSSAMTPSGSSSTSSGLGLSVLQNSHIFDRNSSVGSSLTNTSSRGKPFGLARRGSSSMLFPRMRGAVSNKYNLGKKGFNSGRKRGAPTLPPARKGRGASGAGGGGRGYRGYFNYQQVTLQSMEATQSAGKEEGEENKLIILNANDKYSMWQDVCAMCGSFGQDQEGRLIACSQCGQCFHPFCANVKVNKVVLEKGWRCLDCTVCEGCGERNDEARLVLCEDCDISCHIYCMTPPLEQVPAGIWKCKWCAVCQYCGATDSGNNSTWQQNYSMCGPCYSMTTCPVCDESYADSELIIQCSNCDRWLHASDDMIHTEDEAEKCIAKGYLCLMCRDPESLPPHLLPPSPPPIKHQTLAKVSSGGATSGSYSAGFSISSNSIVSPARSESPIDFISKVNPNAEHWMDGTCLSDFGLHQIQTMTMQPYKPIKKPKNLKGMRTSRGPSIDSTGSRDLDDDDDDDEDKMDCAPVALHWVYGMKEGTLLNAKDHGDPPDLPDDRFYTLPGPEPGTFILRKRRYRNIKTVGIGGFQVRARAKRDEEKAREEAEMDPQQLEIRRKRTKWRTKKKIKILEKFPSYIQEAFFGRNLMDTSNLNEDKEELEELDEKPTTATYTAAKIQPSIRLSQDEVELVHAAKEKHELSKKRKLDDYSPPSDDQQTKSSPLKNSPSSSSESQIKVEEKKLKEEKVEDIVEDDENNDAIEALFGVGGSALISDDLVLDIMKDEDVSFNEDKDQLDSETSVDAESKLTDLLGPGFDLEDVDDIMKNLREDATEDNTASRANTQDKRAVPVTSVTPHIVNAAPPPVAVTTIIHHSPQPMQQTPTLSNVAVGPTTPNLPSSSLGMSRPPNQPAMAPLGAPIPGILNVHEQHTGVPFQPLVKASVMSSMPSPSGASYDSHPTSLPSFGERHSHQMQHRIEYSNPPLSAPPNVNVMQVASQQGPKSVVGTLVSQQPGIQTVKGNHGVGPPQHNIQHHQKIPLAHSSPMAVHSMPAGGAVSVQQQSSPGVKIHAMGNTTPSHQPSPNYLSHYGSNETSPVLNNPEVATKTVGSSESQSLSLTLEEDEALGDKATKAAVLYTNIHKPLMRAEVDLPADRERQIKRIWKNLDADQRKIYTQKARENKKEYFKNKQLRSSIRVSIPPSTPAPQDCISPTSLSPALSISPSMEELSHCSSSSTSQTSSSSSLTTCSPRETHPSIPSLTLTSKNLSSSTFIPHHNTTFSSASSSVPFPFSGLSSSAGTSNITDSLMSCLSSLPSSLSLFPSFGTSGSNASNKAPSERIIMTAGKIAEVQTCSPPTLLTISPNLSISNSSESLSTTTSHTSSVNDTSPHQVTSSTVVERVVDSDHPIRVLTPLEIMRTLPVLQHQDDGLSSPTANDCSPITSSPYSVSTSPSSTAIVVTTNAATSLSITSNIATITSTATITTSLREHQRALKSQEKEAAAAATASGEPKTNVGAANTSRVPSNAPYSQSTIIHQRPQVAQYAQAPPTPRPHDEGSYLPHASPQGTPVHRAEPPHVMKWEDGSHSPNVPQPMSSPTRPIGQFRQPLPPMGVSQQIRMRVPVHSSGASGTQIMDPRMRLILQQQQQQRQLQLHSQQQLHLQNQPSQQQQIQSPKTLQSQQPHPQFQSQQQIQSQQHQMQSQQQQLQSQRQQQPLQNQPQQHMLPQSQQQNQQLQTQQHLPTQQLLAAQQQLQNQQHQHLQQQRLQSQQQQLQSQQQQMQSQQHQQQSQQQQHQQLQSQPQQHQQLQNQPQQHQQLQNQPQQHQQLQNQPQQHQQLQNQPQQHQPLQSQPQQHQPLQSQPQQHQPLQNQPQQHQPLQNQPQQHQQLQSQPQQHQQLQSQPQQHQQLQSQPQQHQQLQSQPQQHQHLQSQPQQHQQVQSQQQQHQQVQSQQQQHHQQLQSQHQQLTSQQQLQSQQQQLKNQQQQLQSQQQLHSQHQQLQSHQQVQNQQMQLQKHSISMQQHPTQMQNVQNPQIISQQHNVKLHASLQQHPRMQHQQILMQNNSKMQPVVTSCQGGPMIMSQTNVNPQAGSHVSSELPEIVTRELEQLEKDQQSKEHNNTASSSGDLEMEGSGDLSQMDDELLSAGIGDFKELLEFAVSNSDKDRIDQGDGSKLDANFFDNFDVDDTKERKHAINSNENKKMNEFFAPSPSMSSMVSSVGHSPMGPSPVHGGPPSGHNSPALIPQGPSSGPMSAPGTPGTPVGSQSPATQGSMNSVPHGPSSAGRMHMSSSPIHQIQGPPMGQSMHLHHPQQGYNSGQMQRMGIPQGAPNTVRHHPGQVHPPPPPPYPGHPQSYARPQIMHGDGLMIKAPMGSPLGGPRSHPHSPVMGSPPMMMGGPHRMPHLGPQMHRRPLLLQEQPLLIEDIIEEEKREQMKQQKAVVGQHGQQQPHVEGGMPGPSVLRPPFQRHLGQSVVGNLYSSSGPTQQISCPPPRPTGDPGLHPALLQAGSRTPTTPNPANIMIKSLPAPPLPSDNPQTEAEMQAQQQYENWLAQQNNLIQTQQKFFDTEITKLRRQRKSLNSRQRTLKKNGQELCERDASELDKVQKEATAIQRQLETCRKSSRQHSMLITEYKNKKRQQQQQMMQSPSPTAGIMSSPQAQIMSGASPRHSSPMHSTPQSPLMSHSPSSQPGIGMIHSPHTPVASPVSAVVPQHSPHGMMIPVPHPSPGDHGSPFSPQSRMSSPTTSTNFSVSQPMAHPMMSHQSMRVRMPVLSPGNQGVQSGQMSPHMMVIRQNYPQMSGSMMTQQQGQQMRHQYSQNVMPLRRHSGSGPVPSPNSSGICSSPVGPSPSPTPSVSMKHSPAHSGLRSPVPLSSPQMRPLSTENPLTPQTPRSVELSGNPLTPHSDQGGYGSQVNSPYTSMPTPTPPSPSINAISQGGYMDSNVSQCLVGNHLENNAMVTSDSRGGGGGGPNTPIPLSRFGFAKLKLKGGTAIKSRWGHLKIGLKGGFPFPAIEKTLSTPSTSETSINSITSISSVLTTTASSSVVHTSNEPVEEGLVGMLSESFKNRHPRTSNAITASHSYTSAGDYSASAVPQFSIAQSKVVIPEPPKSDIPPSSRHQAVIGIPGGGAIPAQASFYPSTNVGVAPGVKISLPVSSVSYSMPTSYPDSTQAFGSSVSSEVDTRLKSGLIVSSGISSTSSLITTPIMSINTTSSAYIPEVTSSAKTSISSLALDVNTLATVVSASSQVSNVLVSLSSSGTGTSHLFTSNPLFVSKSSISTAQASTISSSGFGAHSQTPLSSIQSTSMSSVMMSPAVQSSQFFPITTDSDRANSVAPTFSTAKTLTLSSVSLPMTLINTATATVGTPLATVHHPPSSVMSYPHSSSSVTVQTRPAMPHTLHHLPQQRMPMVLATGSQGLPPSLQVVTQQGSTSNNQTTRIIGSPIQQGGGSVVVQNQIPGQSPTTQIVQLPSLSHLSAGQLTRAQVVQSINQYGQVVQTSPSGQLIVQQHHQPGSMVLTNSSGQQVRMVGQQVMVPQGVIRGSGVMVKSAPHTQGGVRMMMIHNSSQKTPTPPPVIARQTSPMMPPPASKSPASHSASPIQRVSPAPSPIAHSPLSPQVKSLSPHHGSPVPSPQNSSTPPMTMLTRKDSEEDKFGSSPVGTPTGVKDVHVPSAPNALLKQLLQNACSSNAVPSGQLVLVRSSPAGITSHLSQVASHIPNSSTVQLTRTLSDAIVARQVLQTATVSHPTGGVIHPSVVNQQPQLPKVTGDGQSVSNVIHSTNPQSVVLSHSSAGNVYTTQIPSGQQVQSLVPTSHFINVRQGQAISVHSPGISNAQPVSSAIMHNSYVLAQASHQRSSSLQQSGSTPLNSMSGVSSMTIAQPNQRMSPLLSQNSYEKNDNNVNTSTKNEMRVLIPESVSGVGNSGDQTPEIHTPNDSFDDPEEAKKVKKRAQNQARRKSQTKDNKVQPAKRARQCSRVEEDYDAYIDGMMSQLRAMPSISILEPEVPRNFSSCPVYGGGELNKLGKKNHKFQNGFLEGIEGFATVRGMNDYYSTQPFGPKSPVVTLAKQGPTQRGFYNQEFTPPKIVLPLEDYSSEVESVCMGKGIMMTGRDNDSPDTVLSSSSPECVMPDSPPPFKGLRLVDMDDDPMEDKRDRSISPSIPLLIPVPLRALTVTNNKKQFDMKDNKENYPDNLSNITMRSKIGLTPSLPLKDLGNVTVALTLSSQASQDVSHALRSLANLLNIPPPKTYNIVNQAFEGKIRKMYKHMNNKDGKEQTVDMQSILNGKVKFCKQCNSLVLHNMLSKKVAELTFLSKEETEGIDDVTFCSKRCYVQFAFAHRMAIDEKNAGTFVPLDKANKPRIRDDKSKDSRFDMVDKSWMKKVTGNRDILNISQLESDRRGLKHKLDEEEEEYPKQPDGKRFRGHHYKFWTKDSHVLPQNYEKPTNKEMTDLLFGMRITYRMPRLPEDSRQCSLCPLYGDYVAQGPSRLLNYDVDKWVHLNCALWAEDVYETMSGSLINVEVALKKAANLTCEHCEQLGASVKCFKVRCSKVYHLNCGVKEGCTFYKNKTVYCPEHINKGEKEDELSSLAVFRRVFIDREENRQIASVMHHAETNHLLRLGSLILINIGQLLPHQLQNFHSPFCIYPIGYQAIRFYWSMRQLHKRCAYECSIHEIDGQPEFRIIVKEEGFDDLHLSSRSPKGVWNKVLEPLTEMRQKADVVKLFPQYISGEDLFGLTEPTIGRILESMPGVESLTDYTFKFGSNPLFELPLAVNPSGCARAEPFNKTILKRHHGMRTTAGTVKSGSNLRTAATIATLTMNFDPFIPFGKTHSRFFQYKKMKNEWRSVVYLARSKIQGLGLYAARDIEKNTAIIEYIGEIIREELSEIREKRYESQNRGIYMFRLDDSRVVDATVVGGLARYVNHSCGPNCFTETVEIERETKIIIVSNRKISRGEELAYDYKFDEEEDHKIPCLCGADNCRKWMN